MFGAEFEVAFREFVAVGGFIVSNDTDTVIAAVCRGDTVEFSTAVCAPHDTFNSAVGTAIAVERFLNAETVTLRRENCFFL